MNTAQPIMKSMGRYAGSREALQSTVNWLITSKRVAQPRPLRPSYQLEPATMKEAIIIVNGQQLTDAQSMTLRVALSGMDFDCGDDEHGRKMEAIYRQNAAQVMRLIVGSTDQPGEK